MPLRQTTSGILAVKEHITTIESAAFAVERRVRKKWEGASGASSEALSLGKQNQEQELGHMVISRHVTPQKNFIFGQYTASIQKTPSAESGGVCEWNSKWNDLSGGWLSIMLLPHFSFLKTQEQIKILGKAATWMFNISFPRLQVRQHCQCPV